MVEKKIRKNEMLLWFGSWTSRFGNLVFDYANSISIVSVFADKPWILALYQSSETMIQIVFNLVGGAKADKGSRKKIVIVTDLLAALICFLLSFLVQSSYMALVMIIANALLAIVSAFNSPTYKSIVRDVIEKDRIAFFNSISNGGGELIKIVGPMIGVTLVGIIGTKGALLFDAFTFVVSAIAESLLVRVTDAPVKSKKKTNVFQEIGIGFQYLFHEKEILFLVILAAIVNFFLAGYDLLLPYTDIMYEGLFNHFYSKALICEAIGGIIGSMICSKVSNKLSNHVSILIISLSLTGVSLMLEPVLAMTNYIVLSLIPFILFGTFLTCFNIMFMSHVQMAVDENYLGRVFSIIFTVAVLFMPLGSLILSSLLNIHQNMSFAFVGCGILLVSVISFALYGNLRKRVDFTK